VLFVNCHPDSTKENKYNSQLFLTSNDVKQYALLELFPYHFKSVARGIIIFIISFLQIDVAVYMLFATSITQQLNSFVKFYCFIFFFFFFHLCDSTQYSKELSREFVKGTIKFRVVIIYNWRE
jgi:hypothetical protein